MADIEQTLREWEFQGGPPRADRWAGEHPTLYAALRGTLFGLMWVPLLWLSLRQGRPLFTWVAAILVVAGGATGFVVTRRATRHTEAALTQWDARGQGAS